MALFNFTYLELCTAIDNWLAANCINTNYNGMPDYFKTEIPTGQSSETKPYTYIKEFKASNPIAKGTKTVFTLTNGIPNGANETTYTWKEIVGEEILDRTFNCSYPTKYILNVTSFVTPDDTGKAKINIDPTILLAECAYIKNRKDDVKTSLKRAIGFILSNCKYYCGFNSQEAFDATSQYLAFIPASTATEYTKDIDISSADFNTIFNKYAFSELSAKSSETAKYTSESFPII